MRQVSAADREQINCMQTHHQYHHHKSFTSEQDEGTESVADTQSG